MEALRFALLYTLREKFSALIFSSLKIFQMRSGNLLISENYVRHVFYIFFCKIFTKLKVDYINITMFCFIYCSTRSYLIT